MTREEYKLLCYMIDQNTKNVAGLFENNKEIDYRGIKKLKADVLELLVDKTIVENTNTDSKAYLKEIAEAKGVDPITGSIEHNSRLFPVAIEAIYRDLDKLEKITKKED